MTANKRKSQIALRYVIIVIVMMALGGIGMFGLAKHRQNTFYTATRAMVISHTIREENNQSNNNFNSSDQQMMPTYKNISQDLTIAKKARTYLPQSLKKDYSAEKLSKIVDSKVSQQSLLLVMKSKANNKKAAVETVNAMAKAMEKELPSIQPGAGKVRLLAPATTNAVDKVTTPHTKKYVAVGLALGAMVGLVICFVEETWSRLL